MKEPPLSRHQRKPSTVQKIKLLCSFNGVFQPRPPSGKLRYVGGETRIISVDRNISFLRFQSKISELRPLNPSFSLKYQLPESNGVDGDIPLVLVTTDEDVKCMIDEYDKLISLGKPHRRLWLFVCNKDNNGYVGPEPNSDSSSFTGFRSKFGNPTMVLGREGKKEIKSSAPHLGRIQNSSNDSLRKMVLEQQVMATQKTRCQSPCGFFISNTSVNSLGDIVYQPQSTKKYHPITVKSHCKSNAMNVSDYNNLQFTRIESQNFGSLNPSPESHIQGNSTIQFLPSRFGEFLPNRGELNAGSAAFQFLKHSHIPIGGVSALKPSIGNNRAWENHQCGIRNHRFGAGDIRNQRINSNYMRNHRGNLMEMGNRRAVGLDGKPYWLRPNSTISKHGQAVRSHLGHFWKPWSGGGLEHAREGMAWMIESSKDSQPSFNLKSGGGILRARILQPTDGRSPPLDHVGEQGGLLATGNPNPLNYHLGYYHGACHASFYQHLQPHSLIENYVPCLKPMTIAEDLSSGLNQAKHETASQTVGNNFHAIPMASSHCPLNGKQTGHDSSNEPLLKDPRKDIDITRCFIDRDYISGFKLRDNSRCDKNVQLDPKTGVKTLISGPDCLDISSGVHLSLDNLSLSSSKEVEPPTLPSSPARGDVLETSPRCEMDLQQNSLDAMDEGHLSSSQSIGKSNGNASNCSLKDPAAQSSKDLSLRKDDQEDTSSSLCIDEKAEVKGSHICSKIVGGICNDLAAFYTHLATKELQTIKNSDLEDIRELGSGTYGTVYYGKWKGSDVAIKRIKPICFTGSEEDRLIADFWKEAHTLGQLHHPNVVAFYGVVTDGPVTNLATVTEYMVNGSLKQVLRRKDRTIDRRKRLIIAMDAAFGMQYVHEKNIVHFDLKADNFLVNMRDPQRPVCKIGDLGLSKIKQRTLISGGIRGTIPWMAPELLNSKDKMVTEKVDVYSFGIVMWELLTGEEPYADMRSEKIIAGIIKGDLRPEVPSWCDPAWRSLMERCWSSDPELRPGFSEIAKELRAMSAAMNIK